MNILKRKQSSLKPRPPKPASAWKLFRTALIDLKQNIKRYSLIIAVVALPMDVLQLTPGLSNDPTFQGYSLVFIVIMNIALIWAIAVRERTGQVPSMASAYYDGSVAIVRFMLIVSAILAMLIPVTFAVVLYLLATSGLQVAGTIQENLLILFVCILISMISGWLIVRFGLAPIIAVADGIRPVHALRYSRMLTQGRFWWVFARYGALILFIIITALPIAGVTALLSAVHLTPIATLFFQFVTTLTALPLINSFLLGLYRNLEQGYQSVQTPAYKASIAGIDNPSKTA